MSELKNGNKDYEKTERMAAQKETATENALEKSRFIARIYVPDKPIQIFNAGFTERRYIKYEEQNSRLDIRMTVSPPNMALEAIDYIKEKGLEGTSLAEIVKKMKGPQTFGFMVTVDVPGTGTGLPKNQWIKSEGGIPGFEAKNYIKFSFGENGFTAESTTLSEEQIAFSLELLKDSIDFTLQATNGKDFPYFEPKKESNTIRSDRFIETLSAESRMMYKYISDSLKEVLDKRIK